jgi:peptidoglycan/LPS O-acetylase OafA/YrhL
MESASRRVEGLPNLNQSHSHRRADIQGLRAIAVLAVLAFHAGLPIPGGFAGVDVFFTVSGFVITSMLQREYLARGRLDFKDFYLRRVKRLAPALSVVVGVTVVLSPFIFSPVGGLPVTAYTGLGSIYMVANVVIARSSDSYFSVPPESNALLNTWSLSVEEQFYLAFPALLLLGWAIGKRLRKGGHVAIALLATLSVLSLIMALLGTSSFAASRPRVHALLGFYSPVPRFWEFSAGALVALVGLGFLAHRSRLARALTWGGLVTIALSFFVFSGNTPWPGPATIVPVVGTVLVLVGGSEGFEAEVRLLTSRLFLAVGNASYSIYLWHWPIVAFAVAISGPSVARQVAATGPLRRPRSCHLHLDRAAPEEQGLPDSEVSGALHIRLDRAPNPCLPNRNHSQQHILGSGISRYRSAASIRHYEGTLLSLLHRPGP